HQPSLPHRHPHSFPTRRSSDLAFPRAVNTNSGPSKLKITDLRVATVVKPGPSPCPLIRIDTDQGVYGIGEVRDGASATYALFLKDRKSTRLNSSHLGISYAVFC